MADSRHIGGKNGENGAADGKNLQGGSAFSRLRSFSPQWWQEWRERDWHSELNTA